MHPDALHMLLLCGCHGHQKQMMLLGTMPAQHQWTVEKACPYEQQLLLQGAHLCMQPRQSHVWVG
jgi:hypothetical protein